VTELSYLNNSHEIRTKLEIQEKTEERSQSFSKLKFSSLKPEVL